MKTCRGHHFVVLPLFKVAAEATVAGIRYKNNGVRAIVIDGLAYSVILRQPLDVEEGLVMFRELVELDVFASEIREYS